MKNFISRFYFIFLTLCSFNPLRPRLEHLEFFSPKGKRQRITKAIDTNLDRANARAFSFEHLEDVEDMEQTAGGLSSFEMETYEREFLEELENVGGNQQLAHAKIGKKYGKRGRAWSYMASKKSTRSLTGAQRGGEVATVTVIATRTSMNINKDLPVQIFNVMDNYADSSVLKRYLPAGVTLVSSNTDATRTNWVFTFQSGSAVDTVVVSCSEVSYNKLQYATNSDLMRIGRTLYKISDKTQQQAFSQRFEIVTQSLFGFGKQNPLTLTNYIDPANFREDSVVISTAFDIDKQSGIIMGVPYVSGGSTFSTTLGLSISRFDQWNRTKLS